MQFSVRITEYQKKIMLNICDADLLGKKIIQDELTIHISQSYYGERFVEREEAESLLKNSSIINMVGKETVSLSVELGIGSESGIKIISDVPFLIVFNMWMQIDWIFILHVLFDFNRNLFYLVGVCLFIDWHN